MGSISNLEFTPLSFLKLLFIPFLFEIVVGGSGHFMEIGPVTVRMLFYFLVIILAFFYYLHKNLIKKEVLFILLSFTFLLVFASFIGWINNASFKLILEDIKPFLFFYVFMFFALVIETEKDIIRASKIIKAGSLFMGIIYVLLILLLLLGKINFFTFYNQQSEIGEIFFRNKFLFFYKGFLYLCVGFIFFLLSKGKENLLATLFLFFCILLTLTRGFILFTILVGTYYVFFINKSAKIKWITFFIGFSFFIYALPLLLDSFGDRSGSNGARITQIKEVKDLVSPSSFFIGHGFGVGTESRKVHMELSFLEIFHKQGILGVFFWVGLFFYIFLQYSRIKIKYYKNLALPFLLSVIFVILQSTTNPYMNNPIGLTVILIAIVVFSKFVELQKNKVL
jgi:hypothetical protein